jgi:hypothetical protein
MAKNIMRYDVADYMDVSSEQDGSDYALLGAGVNSLNESPNAQESTKTYVNDKNSTTITRSYQTEFSFEAELIVEEEALMKIYDIARNQKTGSDAQVNYVRVELFEAVEGQANTYKARKFVTSVVVTDIAGAGGEELVESGSLKAVGDFVDGTFNTSTRTFTATTTSL